MARSCGIRLGHRTFEIVVLDGGPRKAKLVHHVAGDLPDRAEDGYEGAREVLREAVKELKVPSDAVGLVIDTGLAAFRTMKVPFSDRAKIEEVIKFEIENQLPQWNIDDVVVDFHVLKSSAVESNLIVTAVPKEAVAERIALCESVGLDPLDVELESSAMVNAAGQAGMFDAESACVLVHFGDTTTSVAVIDAGELRSMRAIHSGAFPTDDAARNPAAAEAHRDEVLARLRRELRRTLSAAQTSQPIEAVYVCGHDAEGLVGEEILDTPVEVLNVLPDESAEGIESPGRFLVAWGAALARLGGGALRSSLRREELRFLGKFERLELPLAVLGLLLITLFSVRTISTKQQIQRQETDLGTWLRASNNYMLGEPEAGKHGNLRRPPENIRDYAKNAERNEVAQTSRFEQLRTVDSMLQKEILDKQRELGSDTTMQQPMSALRSSTLLLGVMEELKGTLGPFSIRRLEADYLSGKGNREDRVVLKLDLVFRGKDSLEATRRYEDFMQTVTSRPWYIEHKAVQENPLETGDGISMEGLQITTDPTRAEPAS